MWADTQGRGALSAVDSHTGVWWEGGRKGKKEGWREEWMDGWMDGEREREREIEREREREVAVLSVTSVL